MQTTTHPLWIGMILALVRWDIIADALWARPVLCSFEADTSRRHAVLKVYGQRLWQSSAHLTIEDSHGKIIVDTLKQIMAVKAPPSSPAVIRNTSVVRSNGRINIQYPADSPQYWWSLDPDRLTQHVQ